MIGGFLRVLAIVSSFSWADSEIVEVDHRGLVDLKPFVCQDITRSSLISRVCYDGPNRYMLIQLGAAYRGYCAIPDQMVAEFLNAPSMGKYFTATIGGAEPNGPFDCADQAPDRSGAPRSGAIRTRSFMKVPADYARNFGKAFPETAAGWAPSANAIR
jgi:hypothetical protein